MKKQIKISAGRRWSFSLLLVAAIAMIAVSCSKDDQMMQETESSELSLMQIIESMSEDNAEFKSGPRAGVSFSTLNVALARTGLASVVSKNRLTIFAPTDAAFAKLGLYPNNIASVPNLKEILLYHVLGSVVYSNQLSEVFVPTLNGAAVEVSLKNGVMINDANVIKADIKARNGVIHAIDKVLFPPDKNLVELALSFDPEFSILVQAVVKAGLDNVLATGGPFTVFAPTNAAFVALLEELPGVNSLDDLDVPTLQKVLLYHVVEGRVFSSDLTTGPVTTLNGTFNVNVQNLTITDFYNRTANLIPSLLNVQATNGVVHVIDRVILPELD